MADYLINEETQRQIAAAIDSAVEEVLSELPNHGSEEGLTPVLGHALMQQSFELPGLKVNFNYRQLNKITEEPRAGADGGFLVRVTVPRQSVRKAALFQAKLLKSTAPTRDLKMNSAEAARLQGQCQDMLRQSKEAVAIFYTGSGIYVVDAAHYATGSARRPLSTSHRLITLGTYLGKWLPRCTRGDESPPLVARVERPGGFKEGFVLDVTSSRDSIPWKADQTETRWRR